MKRAELDRRSVLRGVGATALLAAGGQLSGCSKGGGDKNTTANNDKVRLPKYVPVTDVHPDLHGTPQGVPDGFLTLPRPVDYKLGTPGNGDTVTAILENGSPLGSAGKNRYWQELNKRLGVDLRLNGVIEDDYPQKLAVTLAGGDLPDYIQLHPEMPRLPELLQSKFADLTEFLSGNAITDYPFLANIPSYAWPNAVYDGRIYGVPYSLAPVGTIMYTRRDILQPKGISTDVSSGAAFLELCHAVSSPKHGHWAHCNPLGFLDFVLEMLGKPAAWTETGGRFTNAYELPEYKRALEIVRREWQLGEIFHPDSFALGGQKQEDLFANGTVLFDYRQSTFW